MDEYLAWLKDAGSKEEWEEKYKEIIGTGYKAKEQAIRALWDNYDA